MKAKTPSRSRRHTSGAASVRPQRQCGLCSSTTKPLTRTECCGQWICDDEDQYVIFSYARNSCSRNHRRFTLCSYHHTEGHAGRWQECDDCRTSFETEMYVYYGTNEYNFEKLANPPAFEPTHCAGCGRVVSFSEDGFTWSAGLYYCEDCSAKRMPAPPDPRPAAPPRRRPRKST